MFENYGNVELKLLDESGEPLTNEILQFTEAGQTKTIIAQVLDNDNDAILGHRLDWTSSAPGFISVTEDFTHGNWESVVIVTAIKPTVANQVVKIRARYESTSHTGEEKTVDAQRIATFARVLGCMDPDALNYNPLATESDGTCKFRQKDSTTRTVGGLVTQHAFVVNLNIKCDYNQISIRTTLAQTITDMMQPYFDDYYDQLRYGKTLLNFDKGSDLPISMANEQLQIINWKRAEGNKVALRLKNVLPTGYQVGRRAMVVREIQNPVFDVIKFLPVEVGPIVPELRPSSPSGRLGTQNKVTGRLVDLLPGIAGGSGALNVSSSYSNFVSNQVLENYYNVNQASMEINADYSNFENFVTFGSAQKRIEVFKAKLDKIQDLITVSPIFVEDLNISGSSAEAGSYNTVFGTLVVAANGTTTLSQSGSSVVYDLLTATTGSPRASYEASASVFVDTSNQVSKQIQDLVRNFDGYESELWFESNLPYSASDESNFNINNQYKVDYTYPKILGIPLATTHASSSDWYDEMSAITTEYDVNNKNRLTENIPDYLWDDEDSVDFITFTDLIGHHFDNVKVYIKNLENLSSRYPKIDKEISAPMAANVIESFGVSIPSISGVEGLVKYVTGDNTGSVSYKKIADEYYNRYVHALPFILKSKGTKQSINSLLNVFGINPNLITVRESLKGAYTTIEPVKVTTTEQDFSLNFSGSTGHSSLNVPFTTASRAPKTVQMRFSLQDARTQTVFDIRGTSGLNMDYKLVAALHPDSTTNAYYTNSGRLEILSGSATWMSSSYFDLFDENPVSVQLRSGSAGVQFDIRKIETEETTVSQSIVETYPSMSKHWNSFKDFHLGSLAPASSGGAASGLSLDEFRLWGEQINDGKFVEFAENPGMFAGNTYSSSLQNLYVRLSFNLPNDVEDAGYVINTSPYVNKAIGLNLTNIVSTGFPTGTSPLYQHQRSIRTVIENSYKAGAGIQTTDMIRIAPAPPLSGSLSRTSTLTSIVKKFQTSSMGSTDIDISISPVDAVDRDVIRSYGNIDLGNFIGRPIDRNADNYPLLDTIEESFVKNLAPTIDYNAFIRFFDKFLHLFGETVKDYFPARANITDGIVIRSPILNRNKLRGRETIKMGGENTRRTNNAITSTTDRDVIRSLDPTLSISSSFVNDLQADYSSIDSSLSLSDYTAGTAVSTTFIVSADGYDQSGFNSLNGIVARPNKERDSTQRADGSFSALPSVFAGSSTASLLSTTPIQNGALAFGPVDDFTSDNIGAYTYFDQSHGLTYIDAIRTLPVTQSWMPAAPNVTSSGWIRNNSYNLGDVVLQPIDTKLYLSGSTYSSGSDLSDNGKYYVCQPQTDRTSAFQSLHPPQLDGNNWVPLKYNKEWYQKLARFAYVGGDTDNVSMLKRIIIPGLRVTGDQIAFGWSPNAELLTSFVDTSTSYNNDPTVTHGANPNIVKGLKVSGVGIEANSYVVSINSTTSFELNRSTTSGARPSTPGATDGHLTFTIPNVTIGSVTNSGGFELSTTNAPDQASFATALFTDATCDTTSPSADVTHDVNPNIVAGLSISGSGIAAGTIITSINSVESFSMVPSATATNSNVTLAFTAPSSSLTFTDSDGHSFVHSCSTTTLGTAVTHVARYDSIPKEYTRKHFRFFRDTSIGARRRTYEGTLNTTTTTVDVGQPFEVFDLNVQTITVGGDDRASGGGGGGTTSTGGTGDSDDFTGTTTSAGPTDGPTDEERAEVYRKVIKEPRITKHPPPRRLDPPSVTPPLPPEPVAIIKIDKIIEIEKEIEDHRLLVHKHDPDADARRAEIVRLKKEAKAISDELADDMVHEDYKRDPVARVERTERPDPFEIKPSGRDLPIPREKEEDFGPSVSDEEDEEFGGSFDPYDGMFDE